MENPLVAEFQYYLDHQKELAKSYEGKYLVIKNLRWSRFSDSLTANLRCIPQL